MNASRRRAVARGGAEGIAEGLLRSADVQTLAWWGGEHLRRFEDDGCPRDVLITRGLVIGNRMLRSEMQLLDGELRLAGQRPLSYAFLQDYAQEDQRRLMITARGAQPQVVVEAGAFHRPDMPLSGIGAMAYRPENFGFSANPLLEPWRAASAPLGLSLVGGIPSVFWVDERLRGDRPLPTSWVDLLDPMWAGDLTIDNLRFVENNRVCHMYLQRFGLDALGRLLGSIDRSVSNVTADVNMASNTTAVHITLFPFLQSCAIRPYVRIVWPEEGAVIQPVFALGAPSLDVVGQTVMGYLLGPRWAAINARNGIVPAVQPGDGVLPLRRDALAWGNPDKLCFCEEQSSDAAADAVALQQIRAIVEARFGKGVDVPCR